MAFVPKGKTSICGVGEMGLGQVKSLHSTHTHTVQQSEGTQPKTSPPIRFDALDTPSSDKAYQVGSLEKGGYSRALKGPEGCNWNGAEVETRAKGSGSGSGLV